MTIEEIDADFVNKMLSAVLALFTDRNKVLLKHKLNEPCLNHQFAICLREYLYDAIEPVDSVDIDCEYNKLLVCGDYEKTINLEDAEAESFIKQFARMSSDKKDAAKKKAVIPDIIVHRREGNNYLVFETKKKGSRATKAKQFDRVKLKKFTRVEGAYRYRFGIYIEFDDGNVDTDKGLSHYFEVYEKGSTIPLTGHKEVVPIMKD